MDIEAATQQLVHKVLDVVISQVLPRVDHSVHVSLHQVSDDVDVLVASLSRGPSNVDQGNDVIVVKEFQKLDLTHNSLRVNKVFESLGNLLDGDLALGGVVVGRADDAVRAVANLLNILEFLFNEESRA